MEPISKERMNNPDGSYVIKEVYDVSYLYDYLSQIKNYDKNNIWLGGISYKDKFFKEVLYNYKIESKENGDYIKKAIYLAPDEDGDLSGIEEYDKNNKFLSGKYYKDKEFKELNREINNKLSLTRILTVALFVLVVIITVTRILKTMNL